MTATMSDILKQLRFALLWVLAAQSSVTAQVNGGESVFQFLSLPASSRLTGLGGAQIAVRDDDPVFAAANPAALNASMGGHLTFNHNFFLSDIQHGYAAYAHHLGKPGFTVHGALQYIQYGEMERADEYGNVQGNVRAAENAFTLGAARPLSNKLSLGLNLRFAVSTLDVYQSSALMADAGVLYSDTASRFSAALTIKNAGTQVTTYSGIQEPLPFDIQISVTQRLKHLPFRFGVVAHHLHEWDIRYDDPDLQDSDILIIGGDQPTENRFGNTMDNLFRHLIFNGEFLLGKNEGFRMRFGYNHLRKRELTVRNYRSLAGFSGGIGIKVKRFRIDFGYASYHLAGGVAHIGIGTNLKDFFR